MEELKSVKRHLLENQFGQIEKTLPSKGPFRCRGQYRPSGQAGGHATIKFFRPYEKARPVCKFLQYDPKGGNSMRIEIFGHAGFRMGVYISV